jgi:hypothetical protein
MRPTSNLGLARPHLVGIGVPADQKLISSIPKARIMKTLAATMMVRTRNDSVSNFEVVLWFSLIGLALSLVLSNLTDLAASLSYAG